VAVFWRSDRVLASGPQTRLWKSTKVAATLTPSGVSR
jgi:hypothetical protein